MNADYQVQPGRVEYPHLVAHVKVRQRGNRNRVVAVQRPGAELHLRPEVLPGLQKGQRVLGSGSGRERPRDDRGGRGGGRVGRRGGRGHGAASSRAVGGERVELSRRSSVTFGVVGGGGGGGGCSVGVAGGATLADHATGGQDLGVAGAGALSRQPESSSSPF